MGRHKETNSQSAVAEAVGVARPIVCRVLNGDPNIRVSPSTRARILETAEQLGYKGERKLRGMHRVGPRVAVRRPVHIEVRVGDECRSAGRATLAQLNDNGCLLEGVRLEPPILPTEAFELVIRIDDGSAISSEVVSLRSSGRLSLGCKFLNLNENQRSTIEALMR